MKNNKQNSEIFDQNIPIHDATARALSKNKINNISKSGIDLKDNFNENTLIINNQYKNISSISRGFVDFTSLSLRYTDKKILKKYLPENPDEKEKFKIINTARSIVIGSKKFIGCKKNLKEIIENNELIFDQGQDREKVKLNSFLFNFFLKNFQNNKVTNFEKFAKKFTKIRKLSINELINKFENQEDFFKSLRKILKDLAYENEESENANQYDQKSEKLEKTDELRKEEKNQSKDKKISIDEIRIKKKIKDLSKHSYSNEGTVSNKIKFEKSNYKVFTKKFDLSINAKKLSSTTELNELRKKLDEEFRDEIELVNRLAKKLEKVLYSINQNYWKFDEDEGYFDNSKFSSFIAKPENASIFKIQNNKAEKNTVVSLLIDNSGSMRGKPIITAVKTSEIIARILEKCKVSVEILGFTTKEWKGGKSKNFWEQSGKLDKPGRLNDLLHIIYKDASSPWKVCKNNLALVLKDGILKENIDGEALLWASKRLKTRIEKKKILIVVSDGAPVDDSTLSANNSNILDDHLKKVINDLEKNKSINLLAIGIGHDVSKYYSNAFTIDDVNKLGEVLVENLVKLLKINSN